MNEKEKQFEITISDLRQLGRDGGVTARLDDGSTMELKPRFGTVSRKGYVNGELVPVSVITDYVKIYSQIRTIKKGDVLIARREKVGKKTILKTTGRGYHKVSKK